MKRLKELDKAAVDAIPKAIGTYGNYYGTSDWVEDGHLDDYIRILLHEYPDSFNKATLVAQARGSSWDTKPEVALAELDVKAPTGMKLFCGGGVRKSVDWECEDDHGSLNRDSGDFYYVIVIAAASKQDAIFAVGRTSEQLKERKERKEAARREEVVRKLQKAMKRAYKDGMTDEEIQELWDSLKVKQVMAA